jgi:hypothetical protein
VELDPNREAEREAAASTLPAPPRTEPILPKGLSALVILFALGGAAIFLFGMPFAGDHENRGAGPPATRIENAPEEIDVSAPPSDDVLTSAGFRPALEELRMTAGEDADLTRLQISPGYGQFHVREGNEPRGFAFGSGTGDSSGLSPIDVQVIGPGSLSDFDFPLRQVHAEAIDRLARAARREEGDAVEINVLDLRRDPVDNRLRWEVVVDSPKRRGAIFHADPSGRRFREAGPGSPVRVSPALRIDPQKVLACVQRAGSDPERIQACLR